VSVRPCTHTHTHVSCCSSPPLLRLRSIANCSNIHRCRYHAARPSLCDRTCAVHARTRSPAVRRPTAEARARCSNGSTRMYVGGTSKIASSIKYLYLLVTGLSSTVIHVSGCAHHRRSRVGVVPFTPFANRSLHITFSNVICALSMCPSGQSIFIGKPDGSCNSMKRFNRAKCALDDASMSMIGVRCSCTCVHAADRASTPSDRARNILHHTATIVL
jgi:hypothetical protein